MKKNSFFSEKDKMLLIGAFALVICFFGINIITDYSVDSYCYYVKKILILFGSA